MTYDMFSQLNMKTTPRLKGRAISPALQCLDVRCLHQNLFLAESEDRRKIKVEIKPVKANGTTPDNVDVLRRTVEGLRLSPTTVVSRFSCIFIKTQMSGYCFKAFVETIFPWSGAGWGWHNLVAPPSAWCFSASLGLLWDPVTFGCSLLLFGGHHSVFLS